MRRTDNVCVTGSSKSAVEGGALMDDGSHTPHAFDALLRCRERLDQAVVAPIAKRSKLDRPRLSKKFKRRRRCQAIRSQRRRRRHGKIFPEPHRPFFCP